MCEENKKELEEKNDCPLRYFVVTRSNLEACRRTETLPIQLKIATGIVHSIKVLVIQILNSNVYISRVLAVVTETSIKNLRLAGS